MPDLRRRTSKLAQRIDLSRIHLTRRHTQLAQQGHRARRANTARVDRRHRQTARHHQAQGLNPGRLHRHGSRLYDLPWLNRLRLAFNGLLIAQSPDTFPLLPRDHLKCLSSNINAYLRIDFPSDLVIRHNTQRFPDLALLACSAL